MAHAVRISVRAALAIVLALVLFAPGTSAAHEVPLIATGVVTDAASGLPIEGVDLMAGYKIGPGDEDYSLVDEARTSADGTFELYGRHGAESGEYLIVALADTYAYTFKDVEWDGGTPLEVNILLEPAKIIAQGKVTDLPTGDPIENATVQATIVGEPVDVITPIALVATARSASDGTYVLYDQWDHGGDEFTFVTNPAPGSGYVVNEQEAVWDGETPLEIDFAMRPLSDTFVPVEGADRYETAIEASRLTYPDGLDPEGERTVVIATGMNWPDALGGTALAGALDGPVLLTRANTLPPGLIAEIRRLEAEKAIILGGTSAVGAAVKSALLAELGAGNVERIAGADRYETTEKVAAEVIGILDDAYDGTAFVATGGDFPDALAAAPLAARQGWPLYLADPVSGISPATIDAMADVERALVLGGTVAVSEATESALEDRFGGDDVTRLWGASRYATAVAIATHAVDHAGHHWDRVGIATGVDFPDALAGGVLQGKIGSVMLLMPAERFDMYIGMALEEHRDDIDRVTFLGGHNAVSEFVRTNTLRAVGYTFGGRVVPMESGAGR